MFLLILILTNLSFNYLNSFQFFMLNLRSGCDGTPERALSVWTVLAPRGTMIKTTAIHPRAGTATALISLI